MTKTFRKQIEDAIDSSYSSDWVWNGSDEVRVESFDLDKAVFNVMAILEKHGLVKDGKPIIKNTDTKG